MISQRKKKKREKRKEKKKKVKGTKKQGNGKDGEKPLALRFVVIEGWTTVSKLGIIWGVELDGYFKVALESGSTRNPRTSVRYHSPQ